MHVMQLSGVSKRVCVAQRRIFCGCHGFSSFLCRGLCACARLCLLMFSNADASMQVDHSAAVQASQGNTTAATRAANSATACELLTTQLQQAY